MHCSTSIDFQHTFSWNQVYDGRFSRNFSSFSMSTHKLKVYFIFIGLLLRLICFDINSKISLIIDVITCYISTFDFILFWYFRICVGSKIIKKRSLKSILNFSLWYKTVKFALSTLKICSLYM